MRRDMFSHGVARKERVDRGRGYGDKGGGAGVKGAGDGERLDGERGKRGRGLYQNLLFFTDFTLFFLCTSVQ